MAMGFLHRGLRLEKKKKEEEEGERRSIGFILIDFAGISTSLEILE